MHRILIFFLLLAALPLQLAADEAVLFSQGKFTIAFKQEAASGIEHAVLTVHGDKLGDAKVFALSDPDRLVVDLPQIVIKRNSSVPVTGSAVIKSLRLGAYSDKTRVVIDLVQSGSPQFTSSQTGNSLQLSIAGNAAASAAVTAIENTPIPIAATTRPVSIIQKSTPTTKPASAPSPAATKAPPIPKILGLRERPQATPAPTATFTPSQASSAPSPSAAIPTSTPELPPTSTPAPVHTATLPSATPTSVPAEVIAVPPSPAASLSEGTTTRSMHSIKFDYLDPDKTPVIRVGLSGPSEFKLMRQDEKSFVLTIPGCSVATEHLKLPQFPPSDFTGFTYIETKVENGSARLYIGVERGVRIASVSKDNDILIRALNR